MRLKLDYRRYRLPLRVAVRTAHQVWTEREGLVVRLTHDAGRVGFGEVAPIPAFGTESVEEAEATLQAFVGWITPTQLDTIPTRFGCVRHALGSALAGIDAQRVTAEAGSAEYRPVAALLPAGRPALAVASANAELGFRVFKWKVGVGDPADELALLDDLCAGLPGGARLRLDANGAWDRRTAERWLERCAERPIEFVEQPCFAGAHASVAERQRAEDLLLGLAHDYPTPLALDESVVSDGDVARWLGAGWRGWFIVKPSLLASPDDVLAALAKAGATVVFSSALETAVGARTALEHAFRWPGEPKALGFGVWPLFADGRFDGPSAAPFIRREDVARLDAHGVWSALT